MLPRKSPAAAVAAIIMVAVPGVLGAQSADSKYDSGTTMFSPKGRLYQAEYASEVRPCNVRTGYSVLYIPAVQRKSRAGWRVGRVCLQY